jgi:hypothetical protein
MTRSGVSLTELFAIIVTGAVSVAGALVSAYYGTRLRRQAQLEEADRLAVRFREPILQAAFNLQSRLFNIARQDFLGRFLTAENATPDEREYAVTNTSYLIGQYLGWVEIVRRESQYIDPRSRVRNREIVHHLERVRDTFSDSTELEDPTLRLFRGEQRAIGEAMLVAVEPSVAGAPRWECKGYGQFVAEHDEEQIQRWFRRIESDVGVLGKDLHSHLERLIELQHGLLDLVGVLDPEAERVPTTQRDRL